MIDATTIIGSIAAALSMASFAPQAWRIVHTRDISGLSTKTYVLTTLGFALWATFGVLKQEWPIIVPNIVCFALAAFILVMLLLPNRKRERIAAAIDPDPSDSDS